MPDPAPTPRIIAVSDRPDLAPLVARWLVQAFAGPRNVEEVTALILAPPVGPEESFVLFDGDVPAGTASLARQDLGSRPDLTPWLAGVVVQPEFRGRGHAVRLVRHVEAFAARVGIATLWLYTATAEPLYAALGWQRVGTETEPHQRARVALMRRDLGGAVR